MKRDKKELRLQEFIDKYLVSIASSSEVSDLDREVSIIAQSPGSPVAVALLNRIPQLVDAGARVCAIFAIPSPEPALASWLDAAGSVRWARDMRLREAHEQLVLGRGFFWSGDAMRREPGKIDLFERYDENAAMLVAHGRRAFERLARASVLIQPRAAAVAAPRQPELADPFAPEKTWSQTNDPAVTEPTARVSTRH